MKEKPILFSAPMVRAILAGAKTQTRRMFSLPRALSSCCESPNRLHVPHNGSDSVLGQCYMRVDHCEACDSMGARILCPYGNAGDRLWVKETFYPTDYNAFFYRADWEDEGGEPEWKWKPSIFMPRKASRITLEITGVRVERLQEVETDDICREGIEATEFMPTLKHGVIDGWLHGEDQKAVREAFQKLWESINGPESWAQNPWVWVIEFEKIRTIGQWKE